MKDSVYLTFNRNRVVSMKRSIPELHAGEYAARIDITVDDKYFKRIIPIARMELDDKFLIEPKVLLEPQEKPEEILGEHEVTQ
jgi:hypothetical protein